MRDTCVCVCVCVSVCVVCVSGCACVVTACACARTSISGVGLVFREVPGVGVQVQSIVKGGGAACCLRPPKTSDLLVSVGVCDTA